MKKKKAKKLGKLLGEIKQIQMKNSFDFVCICGCGMDVRHEDYERTHRVESTYEVENPKEAIGQARKNTPVFSGVLAYFPDALKEVSKASLAGNKQHLDGKPLHWDRSKSTDQLDALTRHLLDHASGEIIDDDGVYHMAKVAWRALAQLQLLIENK